MIYIKKSDGSALQAQLDAAKTQDNANVYRTGPVYQQIKADFHEKCYLCEDNEITAIQIEHFEPHKNDLAKKYDWNNLFYSCGHCNNTKGAGFWPLLNCTNPDDQVWESIEIHFTPFPRASVEIKLNPACPDPQAGENTRKLLEKALAGTDATPMKIDEAKNLRKKMLRAYTNLSDAIARQDLAAVKAAVSDQAAFAGMLRWYLKTDFPDWFKRAMPA